MTTIYFIDHPLFDNFRNGYFFVINLRSRQFIFNKIIDFKNIIWRIIVVEEPKTINMGLTTFLVFNSDHCLA